MTNKNQCEYKNKYGRCEIDDYNCFYKDYEKIEQCKSAKVEWSIATSRRRKHTNYKFEVVEV